MSVARGFNDRPIAVKVNVIMLCALAILLTSAIFALSGWVTRIVTEDSVNSVRQSNSQTVLMFSVFDADLRSNASRFANVFRERFPQHFTLDSNAHVRVGGRDTPTLRVGNSAINNDNSIVDDFTRLSEAVATVFVRDGDDFVRISTSVLNDKRERAIGTLMDRTHPAYARLMNDQTYVGLAILYGRNYMTHYTPIKDSAGRIVGALFVGLDFTDEFNALKEKIVGFRFRETGYMYVLDANEANKGTVVIHRTLEGRNLYDVRDPNGVAYVREMIEKKTGMISYVFQDADNRSAARAQIALFNHFPEWNWIIVSTINKDDVAKSAIMIRNGLMLGSIGLGALLLMVIFLSTRHWVSQPLAQAVSAMEAMATGKLNIVIPEQNNDEVGRLLHATNIMAGEMRSALASIKQVALNLERDADFLTGSANKTASQSAQQSEAAASVAASVEEMSVSISQVADDAKRANDITLDSARASSEGAGVIQQAVGSMKAIADTVHTTSTTITQLGEKSQAISNIVNVIREIADQTNLLALNAAIEAARAGEQGRGFAVVADEVRKLAERTSNSTQEIAKMIQRILDGTSEAVKQIDESMEQVKHGVAFADQAGNSIAAIKDSSGDVTVAVTSISDALKEQSAAVHEIAKNIEQITAMADMNSETAQESARCAATLDKLAHTLNQSVKRFEI